ncbi:RNP-1 like RNA-binding protein [Gloeothece citriformis PCC 7424]|uniref:RNP-1 like RNA-binding protein n=1 Tax=Gloeothece citriformis (strain PCC 7424) TaxID=65393 RepID=B7KJT9_GLOC7|nr:RNA-binding protein [Gloeothece citriformis]ACK69538.1 RNP-1 like RNA-binding protein [Gloeothece citriformis PCC 7424]
MSIYVGNLPFEVEEKHINDVFADYGQVKRVYMPVDRETGRRRGFAFVEMETQSQEASAIAELDRAEWMGRQLKVNKAREREERSRDGGGYRNKSRF